MGNAGHNISLEKDDVTDDQILEFYNFATTTLLTALEVYRNFLIIDDFWFWNNVFVCIFLGRPESCL